MSKPLRRAVSAVLLGAAALLLLPPGERDLARGAATWRSALYPEAWTPAFTAPDGAFLHDFSYAGYRNGEVEPPAEPPGATVDAAAEHGADTTGETDATAAIQAAIDAVSAAQGGVVFLPAGTYRVDGRLDVTTPGIVVRGAGPESTLLHFTLGAAMTGRAHLTLRGAVTREADVLLGADGESRAHDVRVADAGGLTPGDEVAVGWVITDAFVEQHGMTGTWQAFNGQWKPFFRRTVTAIDRTTTPHTVSLDIPLRYPALVRDGASLRRETGYLRECGVESLSVTNAVDRSVAWSNDRVHAIDLIDTADCWVRDVYSAPPPGDPGGDHLQSGGVLVVTSKRVTVADCRMARAQHRGGGGNGYLFEVSRSGEVLFRDCTAEDGRHNFIQNWDFGATGCVFLRCVSRRSRAYFQENIAFFIPAYCEFHHSLATANLVDSCHVEDGWYGGNRGSESSGAGHAATENAFWNVSGGGLIRSFQYGRGYVIGPGDMEVRTSLTDVRAPGTAPEDDVETAPNAAALVPSSLYEDQLDRRLGRSSTTLLTTAGSLTDDTRTGRDRLAVRSRFLPVPTERFDPARDAVHIALSDLTWSLATDVSAGDTDWRSTRRHATWKSARDSVPRRRIRIARRTGKVRVRIDRLDLDAAPSGPIEVRVRLGDLDATDRRAWRPTRRTPRKVTVRLRYP